MPLYVFARFEPNAGKLQELQDELIRMLTPTRAEPGCVRVHLYEATEGAPAFFVHAEWTDEQAFAAHVKMPHVKRFAGRSAELMANPFRAARTRQIV